VIASSTPALPPQSGSEPRVATAGARFSGRLSVIALIGLATVSLVYLSFNQGGFFPSSTGLAAVGFAAALVLRTTLAERPFEGYNRPLGVVLVALAFLALWQLISALWSHATARALDEYDRTLLYLLGFALFASLPRTLARIKWLVRSLAAGMTAICLAGLSSRVLPHLWPTAASFHTDRLTYPLTYDNAEGLLAALASILLIHLAASEAEHPVTRVLAAVFVPATAATLLLTFSRGAVAAGTMGVVVYLVVGRPRAVLGAAAALVPTTAIAVHSAYSAELLASSNPTSAAAVAEGRHVALTVAFCMVVAGCIRAVMLPGDALAIRVLSGRPRWRVIRRAFALVVTTGAAIVVVSLALTGFIGQEWNQFARANGGTRVTRNRLGSLSGSNRVELWRVAVDAFRARPLLGYGAGTYELYYASHGTPDNSVTDAHELYLQTLAELGIVGFVPLAIAVLGVLLLLARRIRGPDRAAYAALFAAAITWAIHAGVDWDWQMPAVTLWCFIAAGAGLATHQTPTGAGVGGLRYRTPMAVGWLVLAIAPLLISVSYARLRVSGQELSAGDCVRARQSAVSSISLLPVRPQTYEILSFCDLQLGFPVEGLRAGALAVHYDPNNWNYHYGMALALAENGLNPTREAAKALKLDPGEAIIQDEVAAFSKGGPATWQQAAPGLLIGGLQSGRLAISNL